MLKMEKDSLVIATVGDKSLHRQWLDGEGYDTCLIYYGDNEGYPEESKYYYTMKGPKYHLIKKVLKSNPELVENYVYFWLPDDDVLLEAQAVTKLFQYMQFFKLELGQPAIVGYYSLSLNLPQPNSRLRFTNFVEIMCPCFARNALLKCVETFDENQSGWSYDALWNELLKHPRRSIAIIDDIIAIHTRPVFGGDLYKNCDQTPDDALEEGKALFDKHDLGKRRWKDLKYAQERHSHDNVVYSIVSKSNEEETPRGERVWPPHNTWQQYLHSLNTQGTNAPIETHPAR